MSDEELVKAYLNNGGTITICDANTSLGYINKSGKLANSFGEEFVNSMLKINGRKHATKKETVCKFCGELFKPAREPYRPHISGKKCIKCQGKPQYMLEGVKRAQGWDNYYEVIEIQENLPSLRKLLSRSFDLVILTKYLEDIKRIKYVKCITRYDKSIEIIEDYIRAYNNARAKPFRSEDDFDF